MEGWEKLPAKRRKLLDGIGLKLAEEVDRLHPAIDSGTKRKGKQTTSNSAASAPTLSPGEEDRPIRKMTSG